MHTRLNLLSRFSLLRYVLPIKSLLIINVIILCRESKWPVYHRSARSYLFKNEKTYDGLLIDPVWRRRRTEAGRSRRTRSGRMGRTRCGWHLGPAGRGWLLGCTGALLLHRHWRWWFNVTGCTGRPHDTRDPIHRRGKDTPTIRRSHPCLHHVLQNNIISREFRLLCRCS